MNFRLFLRQAFPQHISNANHKQHAQYHDQQKQPGIALPSIERLLNDLVNQSFLEMAMFGESRRQAITSGFPFALNHHHCRLAIIVIRVLQYLFQRLQVDRKQLLIIAQIFTIPLADNQAFFILGKPLLNFNNIVANGFFVRRFFGPLDI